jgi:hypothetical protein
MSMATGDVLVVLGDDDLFVDASALSTYADAFQRNPSVHFCCSNLLQVDETLRVTLAYPVATTRELFLHAGDASLRGAWLNSIVITGLGFRRSDLLTHYYPHEQLSPGVDRLFPQVELVGRLLLEHDALLIGRYLCGFRAHEGQLGFKAARGSVGGRVAAHPLVELPAIAERLAATCPKSGPLFAEICTADRSRRWTDVVNERIQVGVGPTRRRVLNYVRAQGARPRMLGLVLVVSLASLLPRPVLVTMKTGARVLIARRRLRRAGIDSNYARRFVGELAER